MLHLILFLSIFLPQTHPCFLGTSDLLLLVAPWYSKVSIYCTKNRPPNSPQLPTSINNCSECLPVSLPYGPCENFFEFICRIWLALGSQVTLSTCPPATDPCTLPNPGIIQLSNIPSLNVINIKTCFKNQLYQGIIYYNILTHFMCTFWWVLTNASTYNHNPNQDMKHFHYPQNFSVPFALCLPSLPPTTTNLISITVNYFCLF